MKPISITIEGINSFTTSQTVDFERVGADNLFCISGSTGSGKSTILDCLIMAIYEKEGTRGNLSEYINLRCDTGKIEMVFELDGVRYRSTRTIKRKGANSFVLFDLDANSPVAEGKEAHAFLEEKIGLSAKEFTKVVVLQQGEFAKFLKAEPSERNDLISKLFSLEKYKGLYGEVHSVQLSLDSQIKLLDERISEFEGVSDEALKTAQTEYEELKTTGGVSARLYENAQKTLIELTAKSNDYALAQKTLADIEKAKLSLSNIAQSEQRAKSFEKTVIAMEAEQKSAEVERDGLTKKVAELEQTKKVFIKIKQDEEKLLADKKAYAIDCEKLAQLKSQLDEKLSTKNRLTRTLEQIKSEKELSFFTFNGDRNDAPTLKAKMEQFSSERARISVDLSLLTDEKYNAIGLRDKEVEKWQKFSLADSHLVEELEKFEQTVALAQKNLDEVKKNNAVAVIRASLTEGDECPVCHGKISGVCVSRTQELDELEKALELAVGTRDKLRVQKENSGKVLATISTNLENYKKQIDETLTKIAQKEKELGELNKTFTVRIEQLAKEFCEVQKQIDLIDTEISKVENDYAQMQAKVEVVGETLKTTQKALASEKSAICGDETAVDNQLKEAKERIKLIEQSRETVQAKRKEYDEGIKVLVQKRNTCEGELKTLQANYKPVEKVDEKDLEGAKATASQCREKLDAINKELGTKGEKIKVLTENLAKKKGFETERKKLETECKKYADLSKMFYGDGFRNFIVGEFIKEVTEVASIKLASLTGGKYTLEYDGDFFVYDFLSNNEKRSCKTLSGGETFLASLALAIAISNELSKSKNFDFFFIDEGFGTLSPEALDTVVDALKELSKDTLVGVITHRGELIDRIDLKIEVTSATEDEGSKISYK